MKTFQYTVHFTGLIYLNVYVRKSIVFEMEVFSLHPLFNNVSIIQLRCFLEMSPDEYNVKKKKKPKIKVMFAVIHKTHPFSSKTNERPTLECTCLSSFPCQHYIIVPAIFPPMT